jgi:hypothetical protein
MDEHQTNSSHHSQRPAEDLLRVPLDQLTARYGARVDALARRLVGSELTPTRPPASRFQSSI